MNISYLQAPPSVVHPQPYGHVSSTNIVHYAQQQSGASVLDGRRKAYDDCKRMVERIASQCRRKNRKFRDLEFDIENDKNKCLHNLTEANIFQPADTRRVTELFDKATFYSGGTKAAEVVQGAVEDCYLVSALSTMTSIPGLVQQLCVARDEEVGVYGFIFYRDCYWFPVIVDDLLFTRVPKYEQLTNSEKELYHFDKGRYNASARKGAETLYFGKAGKTGDTWVPLVEKAYAKAHGDYASVMYGRTCDALEDMTGGVSNLILTKDILDIDKFWTDELLKVNKDRLFGCWFKALDGSRNNVKNPTVEGLVGNLSHSVIRAVECKGKRFVVLRDPWGEAVWDGPWSNGSKEWTPEWLEILPQLGHDFSNEGQFVMEYNDFLSAWQEIQRTFIFDDNWVMSSQWLYLPERPSVTPWQHGDVSFAFSLTVASPTIIVLAKIDSRYFKDMQGCNIWNLDFVLIKEGQIEPLAESSYSFFYTRSVSLEIDLEPGNYVVHVRLDAASVRDRDYIRAGLNSGWDRRKVARILAQRAQSFSVASNHKAYDAYLVKGLPELLADDASKLDRVALNAVNTYAPDMQRGEGVTVTTTTQTVVSKHNAHDLHPHGNVINAQDRSDARIRNLQYQQIPPSTHEFRHSVQGGQPQVIYSAAEPGWVGAGGESDSSSSDSDSPSIKPTYSPRIPSGPAATSTPASRLQQPPPPPPPPVPMVTRAYPSPALPSQFEEEHALVVGVKVYTHKIAPTSIVGRLRAQRDA